MKNTRLQGFTLVEMAIVLVIISTIVGAILLTQNLITTSRLQTVITDANAYNTAAVNFKQTYQQLPGDFNGAITLWNQDSSCGGSTSGTCNGSGNGQITPASGASSVGEMFLFWQHLFLAGMMSQTSATTSGSGGGYDTLIGINAPVGSIKGSGFSITWIGTIGSGDANFFTGAYGNAMFFGASRGIVGGAVDYSYTRDGILTPDQAQSIDAKIDDGSPSSGKVLAFIPASTITPNCTVLKSSVYYYNVSTSNLCSLIFAMGL